MVDAISIGMRPEASNFDNSPVLNNWIQSCVTDCTLVLPKGHYYFNTPLKPINKTIHILGSGMNDTILLKNYNVKTPFLHWISGGGSSIRNLTLGANLGAGVDALLLESQSDGRSPDFFVAEDLNVTVYNGATWGVALNLNGVYRAKGSPYGLRDLSLRNVFTFGTTTAAMNINTVAGAMISGQFYPAGGTTNEIVFNAWGYAPTSGVVLIAPSLGPLRLMNVTNTIIMSPVYGKITKLNANVKIL